MKTSPAVVTTRLEQYWYFILIIPPVLIPLGISEIGDWVIASNLNCCSDYKIKPGQAVSVNYLYAFYGWICSLVAMTLVGIAGASYAYRIFNNEAFKYRRQLRTTAWVLVSIIITGLLFIRGVSDEYIRTDAMKLLLQDTVGSVTFADNSLLLDRVVVFLAITDFLWIPPAVILVMAAITCVSPSRTEHPGELARERNTVARNTLYFAAAMMVTGMIAIHFLLAIPAGLYEKPPTPILNLADAIELQLGYSYTLIILSVYLPVAFLLYKKSHEEHLANEAGHAVASTMKEAFFQAWLPARSLVIQLLAIFSPLLTEPVIRLLGAMAGGG